jgi:hypothetical protein
MVKINTFLLSGGRRRGRTLKAMYKRSWTRMIIARNAASNPFQFGVLIVDISEVKLPDEAKQYNLPPECGQPIDTYQKMTPFPEKSALVT